MMVFVARKEGPGLKPLVICALFVGLKPHANPEVLLAPEPDNGERRTQNERYQRPHARLI
jgi:hypothetical protein